MPDLIATESVNLYLQLLGLGAVGPRLGETQVITVVDDQF